MSFEDVLKEVTEEVLEDLLPPASIETHTAGYWDEIGIFVEVGDEATDQQVLDVANALLDRLTEAADNYDTDWTWLVSFRRSGELIRGVLPGDRPRRICKNCFDEVFALGDACSNCHSSWK